MSFAVKTLFFCSIWFELSTIFVHNFGYLGLISRVNGLYIGCYQTASKCSRLNLEIFGKKNTLKSHLIWRLEGIGIATSKGCDLVVSKLQHARPEIQTLPAAKGCRYYQKMP